VVTGSLQALLDLLEQAVMIREDDVFLGPVVPEERRAPESCSFGDVVNGGLLVAALVEQGEGGLREAVTR
jgi:hypothetical protein